jgi:hypothetical protein
MHTTNSTGQSLDVRLTLDELRIINNALNEICHGIELPEFETRIGASIERAKSLLNEVGDAIARADE